MRTTTDVIHELRTEAEGLWHTALAVGFENTTTFIFANQGTESEQVAQLNSAIQAGGSPIGLIGIRRGSGVASFECKPLEEYRGEPWAMDFLESLTTTLGAMVSAEVGGAN